MIGVALAQKAESILSLLPIPTWEKEGKAKWSAFRAAQEEEEEKEQEKRKRHTALSDNLGCLLNEMQRFLESWQKLY